MVKVITRYAPSPTGNPHLGNIRTAIFAYLWARHNNGNFLLRIEDTDRERLVPGAVESIEESLHWLGLNYDDEKIFQSNRKDIHAKFAEKLVKEGKAYRCFCTKQRLEKLREEQTQKKLPPGYDGCCRNLSEADVAEHSSTNNDFVIRFKMPRNGKAIWEDGVRGRVEIDYSILNDPIILKADGWPTYHLASIIDDHDSGVTDVIRAEEWISSTPIHLALYKSLGWDAPKFSHMPHINGSDGAKLSKRHGDTALLDYREKGYLPEALLNFLALLGWNDGTENEYFTMDELVKGFEINRIGKSPAVFDPKKLDWMNGHYIRNMSTEELQKRITGLLPKEKIVKLDGFYKILEVEKTRLVTLCDITKDTEFYAKAPKLDSSLIVFKKSTNKDTKKALEAAIAYLKSKSWPDSVDKINALLTEIVKNENLNNGDLFWPIRYSLSGLEKSASPAELLWVLGKEESLRRISVALNQL